METLREWNASNIDMLSVSYGTRIGHFISRGLLAMVITLNDKAEVVTVCRIDATSPNGCTSWEKKKPITSDVRKLRAKLVETGSVHGRRCSVVPRVVTSEGVEVALQNFVQANPMISNRRPAKQLFINTSAGNKIRRHRRFRSQKHFVRSSWCQTQWRDRKSFRLTLKLWI